MSALLAALLLQYVVSVKAGLVNHVQGIVNVAEGETARVARPIRTGEDGYAEVLLTPGSFMRLGENSEARIDDANLASVKVTVLHGPMVVEVVEISRNAPITITTGNLVTKIVDSGIYRFTDGAATVIQGKLQTPDSKLTWEKGWQVFFQDNYRARKAAKVQVTSLDLYSETRSSLIARANNALANSMSVPAGYNVYDSWLYDPAIGMYTFFPHYGFRSPYGYRYYDVGRGRVVRHNNNNGSSYDNNVSSGGNNSNSGGNSNSNSGGGNSGGGAPAPAPVVSTPSGQQSAPAVYIESKDSPVGATTK
jgi:uncharacterized membrane protein YgcG